MSNGSPPPRASTGYHWLLVVLLSCQSGVLAFDRGTFSLLSPYVKPDLGLSNTEIGMISGALSLSWAFSGLFVGGVSDRLGRRKILLVSTTILFSLASVLSAFARSFAALAGARLLLGLSGGGGPPIAQAMVVAEVAPGRRGVAQATIAVAGNLFGGFLAPILTVGIAVAYGWRSAFFLAGLPGLAIALCIALFLREVKVERHTKGGRRGGVFDLLRDRTLLICLALAVLLVGAGGLGGFLPLYLTQVVGITPTQMSWIMAGAAPAGLICGIGLPWLSDRLGRKPMMIAAQLIALPGYYFLMASGGSAWLLLTGAVLGAAIAGMMPIALAIVPAEAVAPHRTATALGLTVAVGQLVGGAGVPVIAGWLADRYGLSVIPWMLMLFAVAACLLTLGLRETAPAKRTDAPGRS
ncbi:MAG: MFS transporter [Sphingomonadales bacterium]